MARKITATNAMISLIANLFMPGLGTIIAGSYDLGTIQLVLFFAGIFMTVTVIGTIIGIPLCISIWIWALTTSIKLRKTAIK